MIINRVLNSMPVDFPTRSQALNIYGHVGFDGIDLATSEMLGATVKVSAPQIYPSFPQFDSAVFLILT